MREKTVNSFPQLDTQTASCIISNVLDACNHEPYTTPLEVLASYAQYRRDRFLLEKCILVFMLVLFLMLPLCFIYPSFSVEEIGRSSTGVPTYQVNVRNFIPVRLVSARLNGRSIPVFESEAKEFTVEANDNGKLTITVTLVNQQFNVWTGHIEGVDATAPILISNSQQDDRIHLVVQETGVGLDYEQSYAVTDSGITLYPISCGPEDENFYLDFDFLENMNIYIRDLNGNVLHLILTIR